MDMANMVMVRSHPHYTIGEGQVQDEARWHESLSGEQEAIDTLIRRLGEPRETKGPLPERESEL